MKKLIYIFIILFSTNVFSQAEASKWYFGSNAALDFISGDPVPITGSLLNTNEGCSSFADSNGDLLFYVGAPNTNARDLTVWNKNNLAMPNGTGLKGDSSSSQSALTVPAPGNSNIYYLFTVGALNPGNTSGFDYYTIDMSMDLGNGDVASGPFDLSDGRASQWSEKVTAVKGDECNEFWVISFVQNTFYAYKVTTAGVSTTPVISTVNTATDVRGYLKVSPDGTKLVSANMGSGTFLYDFDDATGTVSNPQTLDINGNNGYGVEFSLSSKKLYISTGNFTGGSQENLYQFDVSTNDITTINASRGLPIHTYNNSRAALQMAPNGKIYRASRNSSRISVINNPELVGTEVDYSHQTVNLGGPTSSDGLPPFISSLLLPLEITEAGSTVPLNNQTHNLCSGTNITFSPEAITGSPNYVWTYDDGTSIVELSNGTLPDLTLTNLSNTVNGTYNLTATVTDACGVPTISEGEFSIEVFDQPTATRPTDINFCDIDGDGFNTFNFDTDSPPLDITSQILGGQAATDFEVLYFNTSQEAIDNVTGTNLSIPFTNPTAFSSQPIHARVQNINNNNCAAFTDFILQVTDLPEPTQPTVYRLCDDTASGSDTDDTTNNFRLETKNTEILGTLNPAQYNVSYHTTLVGATDGTLNIIPQNTDYVVTNSQIVFVRVENVDNANCNAVSDDTAGSSFMSFQLIVDPLPVVNDPVELIQCHNNTDLNTTVNLTLARANISTNYLNETFEYYATEPEAIAGTPQITGTDIETYPVTGTGEAWVRVLSNSNSNCYRISKINITVNFSADLTYNKLYTECDDFLDADGNNTAANSDTDGISTFNFTDAVDEIKAFFPVLTRPNLDVLFYESFSDRAASIDEIPDISIHRNNSDPAFANNQTIYVKIVNNTNNGCAGTANILLQVNPIPTLNTVDNLELCDDDTDSDDTNGIGVEFDLESQSDLIRQTGMTAADFPVTYHLSFADATSGASPQSSPYPNITNGETIFVRVVNTVTTCVNPHMTFTLDVNPLPIIDFTNISLDSQCDNDDDSDDTNGIGVEFDLGSIRAAFQSLQPDFPAVNYTVDYFASSPDAQANLPTNRLLDMYPNITNNQSIFVRIENDDTGCIRIEESPIFLVVDPLPIIAPITVNPKCDDDDDGDDSNGVVTWNLNGHVATFNAMQTSTDAMSVTFHTTLTGANSPLPADQITDANAYENISNPEQIFVRITNDVTGCYRGIYVFDLVVDQKPEFDDIDDQIVCENILPHQISVENPDATDYNYEWFNSNGTSIGTDQTLEITDVTNISITGVEYSVTVTNPLAGCFRTKTFNIKKSSIATLLDEDIVTVEFNSPTNSIEIITTNLGFGDYEYALQHDADARPFQDDPIFTNLQGGVYTVLINDKNDCGEISKVIFLLDYPKFLTPNNDDHNDYWQLIGLDSTTFTVSPIQIFDRFGKIVAIIDPIQGQGWDGLYNNEMLPSSDYWFALSITDNLGQIFIKKGNFSLIRR